MQTPVIFLIFNRPDTTAQVFAEIAKARPRRLLVVADGPRPHRPDDVEKCAAARAIIDQVDWDCEVMTNFAETNMGLKDRVASGLTWGFEQVEEAIVLEDDCVPHPTFFRFCEELLAKYRHDSRVMTISGNNFQFGRRRTSYSYYFSRYNHCWGWASWRRAWQYYDHEMRLWPEIRDGNWLYDILQDRSAVRYWRRIFQRTYDNEINSWAYRWTFACWVQSGLTVLPAVNLVSNVGFDQEATHTRGRSRVAYLPTEPLNWPLMHPPFVIQDIEADRSTHQLHSPPFASLIRLAVKARNLLLRRQTRMHFL
ncbi:MAG: hemolytic protein HlpA [Litorilinea sp.]|nr:MAG: hemolytic protein HlpA [Litorilinea sp.]